MKLQSGKAGRLTFEEKLAVECFKKRDDPVVVNDNEENYGTVASAFLADFQGMIIF